MKTFAKSNDIKDFITQRTQEFLMTDVGADWFSQWQRDIDLYGEYKIAETEFTDQRFWKRASKMKTKSFLNSSANNDIKNVMRNLATSMYVFAEIDEDVLSRSSERQILEGHVRTFRNDSTFGLESTMDIEVFTTSDGELLLWGLNVD